MNQFKQTQGQKKLQQYLEDLKRNKIFMAKLNKIRAILKSKKEDKKDDEKERAFNKYLEEYEEYRNWLKNEVKSYRTKFDEIYE